MSDSHHHWILNPSPCLHNCVLYAVALWWLTTAICLGQCPSNSVTFEKIAGVTLQDVRFVPLYKGTQGELAVTQDCLTRCRSSIDCQSLSVSYTNLNCMKSTVSSEGRRNTITGTSPASATSYFEKICLTGPRCQRLWAFERVIGFEIAGFDDRTIPGVSSRVRCQELCLRERGFACRSGEFDYAFQQCRLSSEDRRSQPSSFRAAFGEVDYFENQCPPAGGSTGCEYEMKPDLEVDRADAASTAATESECRQQCDVNEQFMCHAFSYYPVTSTCRMSSDDTYNMGPGILKRRIGSEYYQKSNCLDLKLMCTGDAMQLILNTREPFSGRIYSQTQPYSCQVYGQKQTVTRFTLGINANCGVETEGNLLTTTVVIQYHPLIQQKGDRVIKLYCSLFEETNRTVAKSFRVGPGPEPPIKTVVNATAPTPNIRLRITDANGTDITGTRIGDPLYFRIEIDEDSVFGIFARNLTARNGLGDREIVLVNEDGCPTDPRIFPVFEKISGTKSLQARFLAFKFAGDPVVRFVVNIHFCLEECTPTICPGGQVSWGKRRRREVTTESPIVPDYPLAAAIVVEGASFNNQNSSSESQDQINQASSDELVCTTKIVVVVSALGALLLQLGLLAACATCLLLTKREPKCYKEDCASTITETLPPFASDTSNRRLR